MLFLDYSPDLSAIDLEIYKYVAANMEKVTYMRIRELAKETHSSTASILRFCKKFECDGFSAFKIKLGIYLENLEKKAEIHAVDESSFLNFVQRSTEAFYQERIETAAKLLKEKELVLFIGVGSSNIIAEYGALYFSSIFSMAFHIADPENHPVNFFNKSITKNTCIIALSVSGENTSVLNYLNHFIRNDSTIISITNSEKSSIANLSDVNIPYYISTERLGNSDITSQVPALYTVEYLAKKVQNYKADHKN